MKVARPILVLGLPILAAALCTLAAPAHAVTINLRSGNAPAGNPDPMIRRLDLASACGAGYATPFTAAEFAAADAGPPAIVLSFVHPAWGQSLPCDPAAQWVGVDPNATPMSELYAIDFFLATDPCCYDKAFLDFCWTADDILGDGVNPAGVYLNGASLPIAGGNYATETVVTAVDILPYIHCGKNTLYIHNRDLGCAVSGINFSARITARECITPASRPSWGKVKATYR